MINKKINIAILTVLILAGCGSNNSVSENKADPIQADSTPTNPIDPIPTDPTPINPTDPIIDPENPDCLIGSASLLGQVLDENKNGLSDIEINIDGCKTVSNSEGFYQLLNIKATDKTMIKITSSKYATAFVPVKIELFYEGTTDHSNNYIKTVLTPYSSNIENHIVLSDSLQKESIKYFRYSNVNTKTERRNFPGSFKGINDNGVEVLFESFGLIELYIRDSSNNKIAVTDPIKLNFNKNTEIERDFITLWKFNEIDFTWRSYGLAEKNTDGSFTAEVDDLGIYSINKQFEEESGLYIGRIVYKDGTPAKDLRVYLTGRNWINYSLTTDDLGEFQIPVKANTQFSIYAFTYRDDYKAEYEGPDLKIIEEGGVNDDRA